jgi:lipopolysaccharide/colanic/teichoic acid biosynthesis glycosyltransferase
MNLKRRTKLDELPQLRNVLKGEMSLVGPRPEVRKWVEVYPERWARVLVLRPGITDPASLIYRHEEELLAHSANHETPSSSFRQVSRPDTIHSSSFRQACGRNPFL